MYPRKEIRFDYDSNMEKLAAFLQKEGYTEHAEYVLEYQDNLRDQLERACRSFYGIAAKEVQEERLEKLTMDMSVNGGYGDDVGDSEAFKEIESIKESLNDVD